MSDGSSAPYPTSIITCVTYTAQPSWNRPLPKIVRSIDGARFP